MARVSPPTASPWLALVDGPLPVAAAVAWATTPRSGAVVTFLGVVRDHDGPREGVTRLTYEAYEEAATRRLGEVAVEAGRRWSALERLALLHRIGDVELSEASVLVVAAAPHRDAAFEAARYCIDTVKETVPIWKREHWSGGSDWAEAARVVRPVTDVAPSGVRTP